MAPSNDTATRGKIKAREWVRLPQDSESTGLPTGPSLRIMTWNMLAQTLVRRELFLGSDCLKGAQREGMLSTEILSYNPDIACLQEVDRLEKLLPPLQQAGYEHIYAAGINKLHGCMIIYKESLFEKRSEDVIYFDEVDLSTYVGSSDNTSGPRSGTTRITKNIGLIVSLERKDRPSGCVVATTHAFWHPKYVYERARQFGILLQNIQRVRESGTASTSWPAYFAGDLNIQPSDAAYALLIGQQPSSEDWVALNDSRVIHRSIDPTVPPSTERKKEDEAESAEQDPDRVITDSRRATTEDRLLTDDELLLLYKGTKLRSAYDAVFTKMPSEHSNTYQARVQSATRGMSEPMFTSFTHYWKVTLDYIFISDPLDAAAPRPEVVGVLKTHRREDMEPGLPRQGICGSDHVSLVAEVVNGG